MDFHRPPAETSRAYEHAKTALLAEARALCAYLLPGGDVRGNEYVCADLAGGRGRSCNVNLTTGKWADFATEEAGTDLISLWAAAREIEQHEAKDEALAWLPNGRATSKPNNQDDKMWWRNCPADRVWGYRDAAGNVVVQVKRWDARDGRKKVIRPWNPATGRYEWPDTDNRPLFNLRDIAAGCDMPVVISGGEKCADAVTDLEFSFVGTTVMGGESAVSRTDFSPLEGRRVIVWPDSDKAGGKWAAQIIKALTEAGAASIHRVEIPAGVPPKWDAADAGPDLRKQLLEQALASPPIVAALAALRADDMTQGEPPPRRWIVRGALPAAVPAVIFGPGASGKSLAVLDLCLKIASRGLYGGELGDPGTFLGPVPIEAAGPVLFITLEDDKEELHRRLHAIDTGGRRQGAPLYIVPGLDIAGFDPSLIRQENRLAALTNLATHGLPRLFGRITKMEGRPPRLVVLDPAGDFVDGSEDDATIIKPLMRYLRELAAKHDCAVILIGHTPKGKGGADSVTERGMRGSGAWTANSRFAFGFWRPGYGQAIRFLKDIGEDPNERNIERVVFGTVMKANHPGAPAGIRKCLQNAETGMPEDMTDAIRARQKSPEAMRAQMLLGIETMAKHGQPFTITGAGGVFARRIYLPPGPLRDDEDLPRQDLEKFVNDLLKSGEVRQYAWQGGTSKKVCYLDVPGGPVAKNLVEAATSDPDYPYSDIKD